MAVIIATVNMKGGVGKTTLSVNLATALARYHNKRVLVVDLDTQISATLSLMPPHDFAKIRKERRTLSYLVYKAVKPESKLPLTIQDIICRYVGTVKGLDLLPGDIDLYDEFLVSEMLHEKAVKEGEQDYIQVWNNFEKVLVKSILEPVLNEYDYIIMDCAPGYNLLTRSGIMASNFYLLPARPEPLSVVGIQLLERRIAKLKETHNIDNNAPNLKLLGIVFIMSGGLIGRYYNQVIQRVNEDFTPVQIFKTRIPLDVNVSKAVDSFLPVVLAFPNSSGSKALMKLTQEFLYKLQVYGSLYEASRTKMNLSKLD
ncbi:MAG TPA: ParA family protein [Candidatus Obscuribacterales bacterium]